MPEEEGGMDDLDQFQSSLLLGGVIPHRQGRL